MDTKDLLRDGYLSRIAEQVAINVLSFIAIGILGLALSIIYSAILLVLRLLHIGPSEISGLLAFVIFGMLLMIIIICLALYNYIRKANRWTLMAMLLLMLLSPSIGHWMEKAFKKANLPQEEDKHV